MNSGTAIRVVLFTVPKIRPGRAERKPASNTPASTPPTANARAVPARVNATGKPSIRNRQTARNM